MSYGQVNVYLEEARLVLENDFSEQRLEKAVAIYCEAIEQYPDESIEPYLATAYIALRTKQWKEAGDLLRQAAAIEPFNPLIHQLMRALKLHTVD